MQKSHVDHRFTYPQEVSNAAESMSFAARISGSVGVRTEPRGSVHNPPSRNAGAIGGEVVGLEAKVYDSKDE